MATKISKAVNTIPDKNQKITDSQCHFAIQNIIPITNNAPISEKYNANVVKVGIPKLSKGRKNVEVKLLRANIDNAEEIHDMQEEAFRELLEKYQDFDTNPGNENVEKVEARFKQNFTFYYFICSGQQKVGAVRVVDIKEAGKNKRL